MSLFKRIGKRAPTQPRPPAVSTGQAYYLDGNEDHRIAIGISPDTEVLKSIILNNEVALNTPNSNMGMLHLYRNTRTLLIQNMHANTFPEKIEQEQKLEQQLNKLITENSILIEMGASIYAKMQKDAKNRAQEAGVNDLDKVTIPALTYAERGRKIQVAQETFIPTLFFTVITHEAFMENPLATAIISEKDPDKQAQRLQEFVEQELISATSPDLSDAEIIANSRRLANSTKRSAFKTLCSVTARAYSRNPNSDEDGKLIHNTGVSAQKYYRTIRDVQGTSEEYASPIDRVAQLEVKLDTALVNMGKLMRRLDESTTPEEAETPSMLLTEEELQRRLALIDASRQKRSTEVREEKVHTEGSEDEPDIPNTNASETDDEESPEGKSRGRRMFETARAFLLRGATIRAIAGMAFYLSHQWRERNTAGDSEESRTQRIFRNSAMGGLFLLLSAGSLIALNVHSKKKESEGTAKDEENHAYRTVITGAVMAAIAAVWKRVSATQEGEEAPTEDETKKTVADTIELYLHKLANMIEGAEANLGEIGFGVQNDPDVSRLDPKSVMRVAKAEALAEKMHSLRVAAAHIDDRITYAALARDVMGSFPIFRDEPGSTIFRFVVESLRDVGTFAETGETVTRIIEMASEIVVQNSNPELTTSQKLFHAIYRVKEMLSGSIRNDSGTAEERYHEELQFIESLRESGHYRSPGSYEDSLNTARENYTHALEVEEMRRLYLLNNKSEEVQSRLDSYIQDTINKNDIKAYAEIKGISLKRAREEILNAPKG